jgi:two-component system phosphate regulon response regulator PhoB
MQTVTIWLTSPLAEPMADLVHDGRRLTFGRLGPRGPESGVKGPLWVFVDWVLDAMAGLEMCRRLRADPLTSDAHLTMVLEADDTTDRRRALRAGADDYIVGPLDRKRILDRVLAVGACPPSREAPPQLSVGDLSIDLTALQARWAGTPVTLPLNEFRLLRFLAENPDRVLSREELIAGLGKHDPPLDERTVDVWISRLRRALRAAGAGDPLRTVRSLGYVFDKP